MKLLRGEIFNAIEPLQKLLGRALPIGISYRLAKMANKLNEEYQIIDEVRRGLVLRYGEPNKDNPSQVTVTPDSKDFAKFTSDMDELFSGEMELVIDKIYLPLEVDGRAFQIEPNVLMALEKFVGIEV